MDGATSLQLLQLLPIPEDFAGWSKGLQASCLLMNLVLPVLEIHEYCAGIIDSLKNKERAQESISELENLYSLYILGNDTGFLKSI